MAIAQVFQGYFKNIFILTVVSLLIACGGGSSSKKDSTPDTFSFMSVTGAAVSSEVTSTAITVVGINKEAAISITGGTYSINNGAFTAAAGTVSSGQTIKVKVTSSSATSTAVTATLTIGGVKGTFAATTLADTTGPTAQIMFPPQVSLSDGATIKVRGTAHDANSSIASVTVNGITATSTDNFATWTADDVPLSLASNGVNTLTVLTTDSIGNSNSDAAHVIVQRVASVADTSVHFPNAVNPFSSPLAAVQDNNRLLVTDFDLGTVIAVNISTGERTIFSPKNSDNNTLLQNIILDNEHNRALLVDTGLDAIYELNLQSGNRTVLFSCSSPNSTTSFTNMMGILTDNQSSPNQVFVSNRFPSSIIKLDSSDACQILSNANTPGITTLFQTPMNMIFDATKANILIADNATPAIISVDVSSGINTVLSSNITHTNNLLNSPEDLVLDLANNRLLVLDSVAKAIFAIDLNAATRGVRTVVSSNTVNLNTRFMSPYNINLDESHNTAFVVDGNLKAIISVDLVTGERVIISK